jgi:hypothetical protein
MARPFSTQSLPPHPAIGTKIKMVFKYGRMCRSVTVTCPTCQSIRWFPTATLRQTLKTKTFSGQCYPCGIKQAHEQRTKTCSVCGETKSILDFSKRRLIRRKHCKSCNNAYLKNKRATDKAWRDKVNARQRLRLLLAPEVKRSWDLRRKYGLSDSDYSNMLASQNNGCAICGATRGGKSNNHKRLCVDHDHKTNAVRGLLCIRCNFIIGNAQDSTDILRTCIAYLERQISLAAA